MTRARKPRELVVAGVMTGTSCDAIDVSVLAFSEKRDRNGNFCWRVLSNSSAPYPKHLRRQVLRVQEPGFQLALRDLLVLERQVGESIGKAVARILKSQGNAVDAVAVHGQTIAHHPAPRGRAGVGGLTLQIGSPESVALATGITVVSHFRDGDIIVGGQGAPLVPLFHLEWVVGHLGKDWLRRGISIHNIGGISNLTYLGPGNRVLAFDTGPGNTWIDEATRKATRGRLQFDRNGRIASSADPCKPAVATLLRDSFLRMAPPKSTGRDQYPYDRFQIAFSNLRPSPAEVVSTATEFTAASIEDAYRRFILKRGLPLSRVLICGGGALNPELMRRIQARMSLHGVGVTSFGALSQGTLESDPQFMEAQAFALLGLRCLRGLPVGGSWTGSNSFAPPGRITPGLNFSKLISKLNPGK